MPLESFLFPSFVAARRRGFKCKAWVDPLLYLMSLLFRAGVALRQFGFYCRWLKRERVDRPVVSIGNLVVGGTGKTPLVRKIVEDLPPGRRYAILTRGYRSQLEACKTPTALLPLSDRERRVDPNRYGDEASLLAAWLPQAAIWIGKDRVSSAKQAVASGADLLLLEDGMQYLRLKRDLEIVLVSPVRFKESTYFLPRGSLRDSPKQLRRADLIVIQEPLTAYDVDGFDAFLRQFSQAPLVGIRRCPYGCLLRRHDRDEEVELSFLNQRRAGLFCGLGSPDSFVDVAQAAGVSLGPFLRLPDHAGPTFKRLTRFERLCRADGCDLLLCTEKDWVKLPRRLPVSLPVAALLIKLEITRGEDHYHELIKNIGKRMEKAA